MTPRRRLLVVQPYLAEYRIPFWELVLPMMLERGIECTLAAGEAIGGQRGRGDMAALPSMVPTKTRSVSLPSGATIRWQSSWQLFDGYDALVMEASGGLVDTSVALLSGKPTALWGHIGAYTKRTSGLDARLERWQLRRARAVFAYTESGRKQAVGNGVPDARVWVLNNTVETTRLVSKLDAMTRVRAASILGLGLQETAHTFAFIGGLDSSKRIGFLAEVLDELWVRDNRLHLLVGGEGVERHRLESAVDRGQVTLLGRVDEEMKAAMGKLAAAILMPGRVGLVAVDSFAMGLPIVTTRWPFHAPEFDYLTPGVDCLVTEDEPRAYADACLELSRDSMALEALQGGARSKGGWPRLDAMAASFVEGSVSLF